MISLHLGTVGVPCIAHRHRKETKYETTIQPLLHRYFPHSLDCIGL